MQKKKKKSKRRTEKNINFASYIRLRLFTHGHEWKFDSQNKVNTSVHFLKLEAHKNEINMDAWKTQVTISSNNLHI